MSRVYPIGDSICINQIMAEPKVNTLISTLRGHDVNTYYHSVNVAYLVEKMLLTANIKGSVEKKYEIIKGALLHDVGKLTISSNLLNKPGELSELEWHIMQSHSLASRELVSEFSDIVKNICYYHHEKLDGTGYPTSLNYIPFYVQLVTTADIYDALMSERTYKKAFCHDQTIEVLRKESINKKINFETIILLESSCDSILKYG